MINPNGEEFNDVPLGGAAGLGGETTYGQFRPVDEESGTTWEQAREKAGAAAQRTQMFMRDNPIPTVLGALGVGIAIGLAIRYASTAADREEPVQEKLGEAWSFLSLPFLWPLWKSVREKAEDAAEVVGDVAEDGMKRLKKVKVSDYTKPIKKYSKSYAKPIKKRWKSWTS